jgi:hypothetical protein
MRMVPLNTKSAFETVMEFYRLWVADGGTTRVRFDRGGEFVNRLMKLFGKAFGVVVEPNKKANNPNASGTIERSNIWTKKLIFSLMHRMNTSKWHLLLPIAELGLNNRWKRGLKMSPQMYALGICLVFLLNKLYSFICVPKYLVLFHPRSSILFLFLSSSLCD